MFGKRKDPVDAFHSLPPQARQRALELDRPYRPGRKPLLLAAVIVVVAQAVMYTVLYVTRPDFVDVPEHMIKKDDAQSVERILRQEMYVPPAASPKAAPANEIGNEQGVVYQNLRSAGSKDLPE